MSKMSIIIPESEGEGLVSSDQLKDVYLGYLKTMRKLRDLARAVKIFRVTFVRVGESNTFGPSFDIVFVDPFGTECSHSMTFEHMGDRGPKPTSQAIVDVLGADKILPRQIRRHLERGAQRIAAINAEFKRLGRHEGYRLEFERGMESPPEDAHHFRAESKEDALKQVAQRLGIAHPMTVKAFRQRGGKAVFADFRQQFFPKAA